MANLAVKAYWNAYTVWHARKESGIPYQPLERILSIQRRRVHAIARHAYEHVPYYREVMNEQGLRPADFRTAADLAQLPVATGHALAEEPRRFLSEDYASRPGLVIDSSGTSGRSKKIRYGAGALFQALAHGQRQRAVFSSFTGKLFGGSELSFLRPGGVAAQIRRFYESNSWTPRRMDLTRFLLPPGEMTIVDTVKAVNEMRPEIIRGYGSYIGALFREVHRQGLDMHLPRLITYGADLMAELDRELIEREFGVPVVSTYQAVEALRIGFQCEARRGFHLFLDDVAVRVVDDEGRDVAPGGSGHIVISNLTNRATVLLNYKLGDVVALGAEPCPCGRSLPVIERIRGRSDDLLRLPDGRILHGLVALEPLRRVPAVQQVQIVQRAPEEFLLRAVCRPGATPGSEQLVRALTSTIGEATSVEVEWLDIIPGGASGKARAVISEVDKL